MDGGSGSGCGCCSCGCGCLAFLVAIIIVVVISFAFFVPMNRNYEHMIPDDFQEYYPEFNDGTSIPTDKGSVLTCYELQETSGITYRSIL